MCDLGLISLGGLALGRQLSHALMLSGFLAMSSLLAGCSDDQPQLFQGYVEGEFVYVGPALSGRMVSLDVERGDRVEAGTLLFELESDQEEDGLAQAEAQLARAEALYSDTLKGLRQPEIDQVVAELDRVRASRRQALLELERRKTLYADRIITQEELDRARTEYQVLDASVRELEARLASAELPARDDHIRAAEAELMAAGAAVEQARWSLEQKRVPCPEAGRVHDVLYTPGEWVGAGSPVVMLLPPHRTKVRFFVHENVAGGLAVGEEVAVTWDGGPGHGITGQVSFISPEVEYTPPVIYSQEFRHKLVVMVEVSFPPETASILHPGQPVDVAIPSLAAAAQAPGQ